jgi:hypothetical protein
MLGLALVQECFIADPHERLALPCVLCDFAPTSNLAVPQPTVTIWPSVHVARPIACVTLADFASEGSRVHSFPEFAFAHEAGVHHFAIMLCVCGVLSVGHLIDAKDESHLWANLHAACLLMLLALGSVRLLQDANSGAIT